MSRGAEVAVCSLINTVWTECRIVDCCTGGASRDQYALKGYRTPTCFATIVPFSGSSYYTVRTPWSHERLTFLKISFVVLVCRCNVANFYFFRFICG
jgi:hypothetical protein